MAKIQIKILRDIMSVVKHKNPYDGIAISCVDGLQIFGFVLYLMEKYGKKKTDLLTMPGGSRAFSLFEEEGRELYPENKERLQKMREVALMEFAICLDHGGYEIHMCDHGKCGLWFDCNEDKKARMMQTASMYVTAIALWNFIKKIKEDRQFAYKYKVDPNNIKVERIIFHYAVVDDDGNLEKIEEVGRLELN